MNELIMFAIGIAIGLVLVGVRELYLYRLDQAEGKPWTRPVAARGRHT